MLKTNVIKKTYKIYKDKAVENGKFHAVTDNSPDNWGMFADDKYDYIGDVEAESMAKAILLAKQDFEVQ